MVFKIVTVVVPRVSTTASSPWALFWSLDHANDVALMFWYHGIGLLKEELEKSVMKSKEINWF